MLKNPLVASPILSFFKQLYTLEIQQEDSNPDYKDKVKMAICCGKNYFALMLQDLIYFNPVYLSYAPAATLKLVMDYAQKHFNNPYFYRLLFKVFQAKTRHLTDQLESFLHTIIRSAINPQPQQLPLSLEEQFLELSTIQCVNKSDIHQMVWEAEQYLTNMNVTSNQQQLTNLVLDMEKVRELQQKLKDNNQIISVLNEFSKSEKVVERPIYKEVEKSKNSIEFEGRYEYDFGPNKLYQGKVKLVGEGKGLNKEQAKRAAARNLVAKIYMYFPDIQQ